MVNNQVFADQPQSSPRRSLNYVGQRELLCFVSYFLPQLTPEIDQQYIHFQLLLLSFLTTRIFCKSHHFVHSFG